MTEIFTAIHGFCEQILTWAGNCPEATVSAWFVSLLLTVSQLAMVVKRCVMGRPEVEGPRTVHVPTPVNVPYVPNDTILKLLRLLQDQDAGWRMTDSAFYPGHTMPILNYGNLAFYQKYHNQDITVRHKTVEVNLHKKSQAPDLDQVLLKTAFEKRLRTEKVKVQSHHEVVSQEAERCVNRELEATLQSL